MTNTFIYSSRPTLEVFMQDKLGTSLFSNLAEPSRRLVKQNMLLSLFHKQKSPDFRRKMKDIAKDNKPLANALVRLRPEMAQSVVMNREYKLALINQLGGGPSVWTLNNLHPTSFTEAMDSLDPRQQKMLRNVAVNIPIKMPNPRAQDKELADLLIKLESYIKKFVYAKLRFIADSNHYEVADLVADLQAKMLQTYRWVYPFRDPDHIINCCKQSVHNAGINLIYHWTSQKRARLTQTDEGGCSNRHEVIIDDLTTSNDPAVDTVDMRLSYEQMMDRYDGQKLLLLRILAQDDSCQPFLRWCNRKTGRSFESLEQALLKIGLPRYLKLVCQYAELPDYKVKSFLETLRAQCA